MMNIIRKAVSAIGITSVIMLGVLVMSRMIETHYKGDTTIAVYILLGIIGTMLILHVILDIFNDRQN